MGLGLGLGSESHVMGRLWSGPHVGGLSPGEFSVQVVCGGVISRGKGAYLLVSVLSGRSIVDL